MKIMMLSGDRSLAAGKRGAFYYMLEEFSKYCERIDILCPDVGEQKVKEIYGNVFIHQGEKRKIAQIFYLAKQGEKLWKEYKHGIVLIHEYPPFYNSLGARLLAKKINAKFIVEIHHIIGYPRAAGFGENINYWLSKQMIPRDCKRFDAVRVVNQKQVPELLKGWGADEKKLRYASSMYIDFDVFRSLDLEKKYDAVFAGRLVKNKNLEMLIEAIRIIRIRIPDFRCAIIGDGPEVKRLKLNAKNAKLENNIEFLGWLPSAEDVARVYNQSKIFVMPSLNEGGPRVCLEAMACGVPVVTTRVGVMLDVINDGKNGFFCDWTAEDMAEKIKKSQDYESIKIISEKARETATQFEKRKMIKILAELYQKITGGN